MRSLLVTFCFALAALAQKPDSVLVVINQNSPISKQIGEYYRAKRAISNTCLLKTTAEEKIDRSVYIQQIEKPIRQCLESRKLVDQILYIVTTMGVPLIVKGKDGMQGDFAAVDSELTLLYRTIKSGPYPLEGPIPNPFFGQRDASFTHPRFPMYLVTRLAGYSFEDVKAIIDKALVAKNRGKFIIDLRANDGTGGNEWLRNAAILLPRERTIIDDSATVLSDLSDVIAVAAWGSNDKARKTRTTNFKWLPGGILTEFVSSNGRTFKRPPDTWNIGSWSNPATFFENSPQSLTADYIHEGASGVSGHVDEPYLAMCPRPDYVLPSYYTGRNLAESFYSGIPALSWQNIVVGDPLCSLGKP